MSEFADALWTTVEEARHEIARLETALIEIHVELLETERRHDMALALHADVTQADSHQEFSAETRRRTPIRGSERNQSWLSAIQAVLRESGEPLHVAEIWERLTDRGFETDASDPLRAIVATAVRNSSSIARVAPNTFALRQD